MEIKSFQKIRDLSLVVVFCIIISLNIWWPLTGMQDAEKSEFRQLAESPLSFEYSNYLNIADFSERFEKYFIDTFPVRYSLIHVDKYIRFTLFHEKFFPDVVVGENNWLYWTKPRNTIVCQKVSPLPKSLLNGWQGEFEGLSNLMESRNIKLYFIVAPSKCSIYPEYVGEQLEPIGNKSRLDQFMEFMEGLDTGITVVDVRSALLAAKSTNQVYYRTDTHWNDFGAYIAYRDLIKTVLPEIKEEELIPFEELIATDPPDPYGALTKFLSIESQFQEEIFQLTLDSDKLMFVSEDEKQIFMNPSATNDFRVLIFHDSFYSSAVSGITNSLISEHFKESVFLNSNRNLFWAPDSPEFIELLDHWKPDIIIVERTERNIPAFISGDPFQNE